jgi:hypothetical protein
VFSRDIALDVRTGDGESGQICANVSRALRNDLTAGRLAFAETSEDLLAEAVSLGEVADLARDCLDKRGQVPRRSGGGLPL